MDDDMETKTVEPQGAQGDRGLYREGYREGYQDAEQAKAAPDQPPEQRKDEPPKRKSLGRRLAPFIAGLLVLAIIAAGVLYWLSARDYETTDDAFIDAHTAQVSSQIAGRVIQVPFDDNAMVKAGQLLAQIDPRDTQVKLDQAKAQVGQAAAQLSQARAQVAVQRASLLQAQAQVQVTQAELLQAQQDLARYRGTDPRAVTRQQVDSATATQHTAEARLDANRSAVTGAQAQVEAGESQIQAAEASLREAQVAQENGELQLSYTRVTAPVDGHLAKRSVEIGTYITPGQALFAVVPDETWVTANFKESQLDRMRPGQAVDISVDAFPELTFHGRVDSFQRGTGTVFSLLPAENATGNYVKVVQRLPVKIVFDDKRAAEYRLAPGLSVQPRVKVR